MTLARKIWKDRRAELAVRKEAGVADPAIVMITIVVLVVLALAGMYIGRGFVEQARDTNAQNDLERIAAAQEFYSAEAAKYTSEIDDLRQGRVSFTISKDVQVDINAGRTWWIAAVKHSASGNTFYRSSGSSEVYQVNPDTGGDKDDDNIYSTPAEVPAPVDASGKAIKPATGESGATWVDLTPVAVK